MNEHPSVSLACLNGPCEGLASEAPSSVMPGHACALPWRSTDGQMRYAVYVVVDWNGAMGLMHLKNYTKPEHAQAKVHRVSAICAANTA